MGIDTEQQARRRILDLVRSVKAELGPQSCPRYEGVDDPIAKHLGIVVKEEPLEFDEGLYIPDPPTIILDPRVGTSDRMHFTFFHEISHHLIRQDGELYSFLHECSPNNDDFKASLDDFCNIGSAEFLIPSDDVHKVIAERGFSITLVEHLEQRYSASKPAIAIQLAQCAKHKCFVVVCEYGLLPQRTTKQITRQVNLRGMPQTRQPQLYVTYSSSSPLVKYRIAKFVPVPKDHVITGAYESRQLVKGQAKIPFRSGTVWKCECEAFFYKGKVYATFNVSSPPTSNQLSFDFMLSDL
jgi:Zn-dependent peptidase ImmA (M78 family)